MVDEETLVRTRRIAGIISMTLGIPNFAIALLTTLMGILTTVALVVLIFTAAGGSETSENPLAPLCMVMIIVIAIGVLVVAVVLTILAIFVAMIMGGQTIGGYFTYKGVNFWRSISLVISGSLVALFIGIAFMIYTIDSGVDTFGEKMILTIGMFELLSFIGTMVSSILIIRSRSTFKKRPKKNKAVK
jgi:hypothetical protein